MRKIVTLLTLLLLTSCGPKLVVSSPTMQNDIYSLALLPRQYPPNVTRERADYIYSAIAAELSAHGYRTIDETITNRLCANGSCLGEKSPASQLGVQAFVDLKIESASRSNFIAGYYNAISGILSLKTPTGNEVLRVEHTESERGGLLFNSGQLLRGLSTTADNSSPEAFNALADKFSKTIVSKLPAAKTTRRIESASTLSINKVALMRAANFSDELCIDAPSSLMAYAILGRSRSTLREVFPGHYCGRFRLDDIPGLTSLAVEIRSAYGESDRQDVNTSTTKSATCDLRDKVRAQLDSSGRLSIALQCLDASGSYTTCTVVPQECRGHEFRVYRSPKQLGPFERFAAFTGPSWSARARASDSFQIVAVDKAGGFSVPVALPNVDYKKDGVA